MEPGKVDQIVRPAPHRLSPGAPPAPGPAALVFPRLPKFWFLLLLAAGSVSVLHAGEMPQAEVVVRGEVFRVDVADNLATQTLGLGGRKTLGPHQGMLFVYTEKGNHGFWMRGMFIPIDIIWLDNRRVVHIESRVPPPAPGTPDFRLPTYAPNIPANFVLEIAAGRARALGLQVGDRVEYRFNLR